MRQCTRSPRHFGTPPKLAENIGERGAIMGCLSLRLSANWLSSTFSSVTEGALFAHLPHLNGFFWASKALIEQKTCPSMAVPHNQLAIYCNCLPVLIKMQSVSGNGNKSYLAQLCPLCSYLSFHVWQEDFWDTGFVCRPQYLSADFLKWWNWELSSTAAPCLIKSNANLLSELEFN